MLFNTFIHLDGIGEKNELLLYKNGIYCWDDLLRTDRLDFISSENLKRLKEDTLNSYKKYTEKDINFFLHRLSKKNAWRVYKEFKRYACFLDIETNGVSGVDSDITLIGIYSNATYRCFINGRNLETFEDEIIKYDLIITFNGGIFDLPVINRYFRTRYFKHIAHIDMRFVCNGFCDTRENCFKGGLKAIERKIGLYRPPSIRDLNGYDAVKLWQRYQNGEEYCLNTLIEYNKYDVLNLAKLSDFIYEYGKSKMIEKGLKITKEGEDE